MDASGFWREETPAAPIQMVNNVKKERKTVESHQALIFKSI
jgi:hypothetical protein